MKGFSPAKTLSLGAALLLCSAAVSTSVSHGRTSVRERAATEKQLPRFAPGVVVVTYRAGTSDEAKRAVERDWGLVADKSCPSKFFVRYFINPRQLAPEGAVESACAAISKRAVVRSAEPDYEITPDQALPNDPQFSGQWALRNTGQLGGTVGADVNAVLGWSHLAAGPDIVVAVLDDGLNYNHPDLAGNVAINQGEIAGNGIDDDANGYVDDVVGWDTADNDNDPAPLAGMDHGTHVAGIVGALTNNATGVAGMGKRIKVLPVRMYKGQSTWLTSLANAVDYARVRSAAAINVSYSIDSFTSFFVEAVQRADAAGIPYINSAGNNGQSIDGLRGLLKQYASNVMFVGATDRTDSLTSFSNFGRTVEIAAPGVSIASTVGANGYANWDGTSMATPFVAATVAMVRAAYPELSASKILGKVKASADIRPGIIPLISGGRLDLANALEPDVTNPGVPKQFKVLGRTSNTIKVSFGSSGDDGATGKAAYYEVHGAYNPINSQLQFEQAPFKQVVAGEVSVGTTLIAQLKGLSPARPYYLAVRARDNQGNRSGLSVLGPAHTMPATFQDSFEGVGWTSQAGKTWTQTNGLSYSGDRAWDDSPGSNYANLENSLLTQDAAFEVTGPARASFMAVLDLEAGYDFLSLEASMDNGTTWSRAGRWSGMSSGWTRLSAALPGTGTRSLRLRFRLTSDDSITRTGVLIDDLAVVSRTVLFTDNVESNAIAWISQSPWQVTGIQSHSASSAWDDSPSGKYQANTDSTLQVASPIDVQGFGDLEFSYWARADLEPDFDILTTSLSVDGGQPIKAGRLTGRNTSWTQFDISFEANASVRPIFRLTTDDVEQFDGVYLDDFSVTGERFIPGMAQTVLTEISFAKQPIPSGTSVTGKVSLMHPAPESGVLVALKSSHSALLAVPADVFVPAGEKSATFVATSPIQSIDRSVTVTASYDSVSQTWAAVIKKVDIASATFNLPSIVAGSDQKAQLTVSLVDPAPDAGLSVTLTSSSAALSVPPTVKFLAGQQSRTISIGPATTVSSEATAEIIASWGPSSKAATLKLVPMKVARVSISPSSFVGGRTVGVTGTVVLNAPAPWLGQVVTLTSNDPTHLGSPPTVLVPSGQTTATFPVTHGETTIDVQAQLVAETNGSSSTCVVNVVPLLPKSISLSRSTVIGGSAVAVTGTVTLNAPAGPGGFEVQLSSNLPAFARPAMTTLLVPEGSTSATFAIDHFLIATSTEVRIRASAGGKLVSAGITVTP